MGYATKLAEDFDLIFYATIQNEPKDVRSVKLKERYEQVLEARNQIIKHLNKEMSEKANQGVTSQEYRNIVDKIANEEHAIVCLKRDYETNSNA